RTPSAPLLNVHPSRSEGHPPPPIRGASAACAVRLRPSAARRKTHPAERPPAPHAQLGIPRLVRGARLVELPSLEPGSRRGESLARGTAGSLVGVQYLLHQRSFCPKLQAQRFAAAPVLHRFAGRRVPPVAGLPEEPLDPRPRPPSHMLQHRQVGAPQCSPERTGLLVQSPHARIELRVLAVTRELPLEHGEAHASLLKIRVAGPLVGRARSRPIHHGAPSLVQDLAEAETTRGKRELTSPPEELVPLVRRPRRG